MHLETRRSYVSPRDLAAAIEVSESSLKRWADDGLLRVTRTAGGHRRIPIGEAIRFVREAKLRMADPARLGLPGLGPTAPEAGPPDAAELEELFRDHRGGEAGRLLVRAFLGGRTVAELCDGPLRAALVRVGNLYEKSPEGIAIEHGAVGACIQALNSMGQCLSSLEPGAPFAIGGAAARDPYILPSLAVSVVLSEVGYRTLNVGPDTPSEALEPAVVRWGAQIVWRSFSTELPAREADRECARIERLTSSADCDVALGGRALRLPIRSSRVHPFASLAELAAFARGRIVGAAERGNAEP